MQMVFKYLKIVVCIIIVLFLKAVHSCSFSVCLTWRISVNKLTLVCKVDNLHLSVYIDDPFGATSADCFLVKDKPLCDSYYKNESITQNPRTHEIVYTWHRQLDHTKINGNWSCRHGSSRDVATVEVTVLEIGGLIRNNCTGTRRESVPYTGGNQCMHRVLFFSLIAYFGAMLVWILVWCKVGEYIKPRIDDIWQKCMCISKIPVWKTVFFFTCISLFFGICALCGLIDDATCISGIILPIAGFILGCVSTPFFINLAVEQRNITNMNRVNDQDQQANCQDVRPMIIETNE